MQVQGISDAHHTTFLPAQTWQSSPRSHLLLLLNHWQRCHLMRWVSSCRSFYLLLQPNSSPNFFLSSFGWILKGVKNTFLNCSLCPCLKAFSPFLVSKTYRKWGQRRLKFSKHSSSSLVYWMRFFNAICVLVGHTTSSWLLKQDFTHNNLIKNYFLLARGHTFHINN